MRKIILASGSEWRKDILRKLVGDNFIAMPSNFEENNDEDIQPKELAEKHAVGKASDVAKRLNEGIVIGADSFVVVDGEVLGKPKDDEDAKRILKKQSGKTIEVHTGICLIDIDNERTISEVETTRIKVRNIDNHEIDDYVASGESMGKAGAFGVQDLGCIFMERIEGDFWNVVGMPVFRLYMMLKELNVNIFEYHE